MALRYIAATNEYELRLTDLVKIDLVEPRNFFIQTINDPDDDPNPMVSHLGNRVQNFNVNFFDDEFIIHRLQGRWSVAYPFGLQGHELLLKIFTVIDGNIISVQNVKGNYEDFRYFCETLMRQSRSAEDKERRRIITSVKDIQTRAPELTQLLYRVLQRDVLSVPTLLTTMHHEALQFTNCVVSLPGRPARYYYVINATDAEIVHDVDKYRILTLDSLLSLLTIKLPTLNVDPYTRRIITSIRKIKFVERPLAKGEALTAVGRGVSGMAGAPQQNLAGLKRRRSIGGGKKFRNKLF
jgi:hypothetical protein